MAARPRRQALSGLMTLVIGSGLAAAIATIGAFVTQSAKIEQENEVSRCGLAAAILQDETLSPYLSEGERAKLLSLANARAKRCMEKR